MSVTEENAAWAAEILADPSVAILDTETTGLRGYVCEIAIMDCAGQSLMNQLVNPQVPVERGAYAVHGLGEQELGDAPVFGDVWPELEKIISDRRIVVYNAEFDSAVIRRELLRMGISPPRLPWECAMIRYSDWAAGWRDARWVKLNGGHRAMADCAAVVERLREMAAVPCLLGTNRDTGGSVSAHGQTATHWLPQPDTESTITACGLDIDGSCDKHRAEGHPCSGYGLAWTLSRDLASYQSRPYENWPPPCPTCQTAAKEGRGEA